MILVFCAFGAELGSLRQLLSDIQPLTRRGLRGFQGFVGGSQVALIATGIGTRRARQAARLAFDCFKDVQWMVTTGVAGALDAALPIGRVVVADRLMLRRDDEFELDTEIEAPVHCRERAGAALGAAPAPFVIGPILTSSQVIAKAADKKRAYEALGAIAVDMESAIIALEATSRGLPFLCLRTIMDTASEEIVTPYLGDENGPIKPFTVAGALMTQPRLAIASVRLLWNLRTATRSLREAMAAVLKTDL